MSNKEQSALGRLYHWESTAADELHFVQPMGDGQVQEYTWAQAMDEARRIAAYLQQQGFPAGSQIALLGKNTAHWMIVDWAIWMAGHVTVPLYPTLNDETVRYILEHSESKLLFVGKLDAWEAMKSGVPSDMPVVTMPLAPEMQGQAWADILATTVPLSGQPDRDLDDMATIVYTSGSTGQPKGVMQSFRSFQVCADRMAEQFDVFGTPRINASDRMLSYLPLAHVAERLVVGNNSNYFGMRVYFAESLDTFLQDLHRARPTIFFSVPRLWTKFHLAICDKLPLKKQRILFNIPILGKKFKHKILAGLGLEHVRMAFTGSAPLPPAILDWYRGLGLELLEAYGMSENMAYSHFTRPGQARTGYVGHANPGVECKIDPDSAEVLVKSPGQMMGYYKNEQATIESYDEDGYFKTGDMGEIDDEGRLRITGRVKDLFKTSKGKYVAPVPIENKMGAHPRIEVICVGGANQPSTFGLVLLSEETIAELASGELARQDVADDLQAQMNEVNGSIDPHEKMAFLVVVKDAWTIENGLLTPTMKIKRNVVEAKYEAQVEGWAKTKQRVIWE
ncbi:MAG: AMP-binding protein [Oceanococcus sp.]